MLQRIGVTSSWLFQWPVFWRLTLASGLLWPETIVALAQWLNGIRDSLVPAIQ